MSLESGTTLGPYEIQKAIDAGGMGEVYLARDLRLGRSVAIKVLPEGFAEDSIRRERFAREARALSSLTHPNICQIFDVGSSDGVDYLVMEYLEGETLRTRLMRGRLPPSEVLSIGIEIASALDSAHRQHIIHRDVKPSNIMLTSSGSKLLDFGLAKDDPRIENDATTLSLTADGSTPGTLLYMAPEQFNGVADARSDVWSLGAVLYEMASGKLLWEETSRADLSAAILTRDPDLAIISNDTLRHTIERCLARDPENRWQTARDVAGELQWIVRGAPSRPRITRLRTSIVTGLSVAALLAAITGWNWSRSGEPDVQYRLSIAPPPGERLLGAAVPVFSISPDGRSVVFRAIDDTSFDRFGTEGSLYIRSLDQFQPQRLTEQGGRSPTFSPDGEWIAFTHGGTLAKIRTTGGASLALSGASVSSRGISWAPDGNLYFAKSYSGGISRIAADGTRPMTVTQPDESAGENSHRWPHALPDGKHLLITVRNERIESFDQATIALLSLETGKWSELFVGGSDARYIPTGHIVFIHNSSLMAIPFDLSSLTIRGSPVSLIDGVKYDSSSGAGQFAIAAESGTLIYAAGPAWPRPSSFLRLTREGAIIARWSVPKGVDSFRMSPNSRTIAIQASAANDDIWAYDIERETLTRVSSLPGDEIYPSWTADGAFLLYGGKDGIFRQVWDGSREAELVVPGLSSNPSSSPDGRVIAYTVYHPDTLNDIWLAPSDRSEPPVLFVGTPSVETAPEFSRDGKWIAYTSNESGRPEVYVRSIAGGRRIQVSSDGGILPRWSPDGRELYYRSGDEFYAVRVALGDRPTVDKPELMFRMAGVRSWDFAGDDFVVMLTPEDGRESAGIDVIPDFYKVVKARVPR